MDGLSFLKTPCTAKQAENWAVVGQWQGSQELVETLAHGTPEAEITEFPAWRRVLP